MKNLIYLTTIITLLVSCKPKESEKDTAMLEVQKPLVLKEALSGKFLMGTALNARQINGYNPEELEVVKSNFNSIVAENCMKSERLVPEKGKYDWSTADKFVEFGEQNGMVVHGHTLIWHSQTPRWFFKDDAGNEIDKEELTKRMQEHIATVVTRYKGRIKSWDVVNEAVLDDGSLRESKFYKLLGEDFIKIAFEAAHEADPDAELYYNDYSTSIPEKRDGIVRMIKNLQDQGVPIHGVGMQGHVGMDYPELKEFEKTIEAFSDLGLKVAVTEFDITVLPSPWKNQGAEVSANFDYEDRMNPYPEKLPDSVNNAFNARCLDFFKLFLKHEDKLDKVTMWGVNDGNSWRNNWPVGGRTDYPLLFDRQNKPKGVVDSIVLLAKK
ncbi:MULTISPECIES: endo-1,4-beta-xylanase [unclassified Leeuwenhoekiella]|uniref:endo-1,4-beta-xylanase n=1 Tax=unclassified Leeuwenhoekiella TaxID=2615029 RepID=UPI000C490778|nr:MULTISPECIES: endo-1,4-beta-xylanase [unclassified Leeuwenhoekiella]MAW93733.1 1,4-beta-xylanase [Leeuwenhoekiella sp.]MBA83044.1 1,4-beta-xylanase [Leeuwenhoekiella sp.]|tara:strand:+ start:4369 stop:5514 length:1146 start_codon:yes stop_codon:yes gene_type:complete